MYLGKAGHMVVYGRKANPKASLIHDEAVMASKAIINIPTWMGYFARWRMKCVSVSKASEIVAGCKRLEKENWRWARWELQKRFSEMQVDSVLSATARPFQPQVAPQSSNEDNEQPVYPPRSGWSGSRPTLDLYCNYYEDSYLMPLVVSSLKGDTSDVFDWTQSITPGGSQDLSTLLQMLHEHYCGSYTFWE